MELTSSVFENNQAIPTRYTGEGQDVSPPLEWSGVPKECKSFALIVEDPDAPKGPGKEHPFVHWLLYNISSSITSLPEGLPQRGLLDIPVSASQGKNSFGSIGYNGPMPPEGHGTHHYEFTIYALDRAPELRSGLTHESLHKELQGRILATATLTGTYERVPAQRAG